MLMRQRREIEEFTKVKEEVLERHRRELKAVQRETPLAMTVREENRPIRPKFKRHSSAVAT